MTFDSYSAWYWPYLFILLAGWLPTDIWRFLGVYLAGHVKEESNLLVFARTLATSLVAAVIAKLVLYPEGALAGSPLALRLGAIALGFAVYITMGRKVYRGVIAGEALLIGGLWWTHSLPVS